MTGNVYGFDHADPDDPEMDEVLRISREEYLSKKSGSAPIAGPGSTSVDGPLYLQRHELSKQLSGLEAEIQEYDDDIKKLQRLRGSRVAERENLLKKLQDMRNGTKGKGRASQDGIDYTMDGFDWSQELKARMKSVFGIDSFRLCQQGVCNANMDGRDIICVMPTGGGKSLTYQLPALLTPGCTLVISPLISLITDQILHLREAGVEAVMLTGGTTKAESNDIRANLTALASDNCVGFVKDIKLCYVTPERIGQSRVFMSVLEKLASAQKLARIVVDEAHCVSQLGHDFRPDYGKLSALRELFPRVPIMALSATCPPRVLQDLIRTLRLKAVVDGTSAKTEGTVYFSAPLYRKNLHYKVLPKPSSANAAIQTMANYILKYHAGDTGIVYCLSKKDAENVAKGLDTSSDGIIKTGVYHADVRDHEKELLHKQWRKGIVKVVCATIAFGLGIDKGDVRFVLHHSMSKSLDGFYQESGRAGRDGKDSDCILYYRPQDAMRLGSLVYVEVDAQAKLHDMLRFAREMVECRKVHFAKYFSASSSLSVTAWTTDDSDALSRCGHCDNCTRPTESVDHRDVTVEAWQTLKILQAMNRLKGRLTLTMMSDLARGFSSDPFEIAGGRSIRVRRGQKFEVDLDVIAGGKVSLNKDDMETLLVDLILFQYLEKNFHVNAYGVNVYIIPGPKAAQLTRLSREHISDGRIKVTCSFMRKDKGKAIERLGKDSGEVADGPKAKGNLKGNVKKRKRVSLALEGDDDGDYEDNGFRKDEEDGGSESRSPVITRELRHESPISGGSDGDECDEWTHSFRSSHPRPKKPRENRANKSGSSGKIIWEGDTEVLVLSSD